MFKNFRWLQLSAVCLLMLLLGRDAYSACPFQGNWSGSWQMANCNGQTFWGYWDATIDSNCYFRGIDSGSSSDLLRGPVNPDTGVGSLSGNSSDCGPITGNIKITASELSGSWSGSGTNGTFTGTGTYTPSCNFSLSPTNASFYSAGGSAYINITAPSGCNWTVSENASWLYITSGTSGSGNGSVHYEVSANSGASRNAMITVAGKSFTVSQNGTVVNGIAPLLNLLLSKKNGNTAPPVNSTLTYSTKAKYADCSTSAYADGNLRVTLDGSAYTSMYYFGMDWHHECSISGPVSYSGMLTGLTEPLDSSEALSLCRQLQENVSFYNYSVNFTNSNNFMCVYHDKRDGSIEEIDISK